MEIPQVFINWVLGLACSLAGWFLRQMWDAQKDMLMTIKMLELKIVGEYVRAVSLDTFKEELITVLRRLEDKLDGKANRDERTR